MFAGIAALFIAVVSLYIIIGRAGSKADSALTVAYSEAGASSAEPHADSGSAADAGSADLLSAEAPPEAALTDDAPPDNTPPDNAPPAGEDKAELAGEVSQEPERAGTVAAEPMPEPPEADTSEETVQLAETAPDRTNNAAAGAVESPEDTPIQPNDAVSAAAESPEALLFAEPFAAYSSVPPEEESQVVSEPDSAASPLNRNIAESARDGYRSERFLTLPPERRTVLAAPPDDPGWNWNPTEEETEAALAAAAEFLIGAQRNESRSDRERAEIESIIRDFDRYYVQFAGQESEGQRVVYCNFFLGDSHLDYWRNDLITVKDGGHSFWNIRYYVDEEVCRGFSVDGQP